METGTPHLLGEPPAPAASRESPPCRPLQVGPRFPPEPSSKPPGHGELRCERHHGCSSGPGAGCRVVGPAAVRGSSGGRGTQEEGAEGGRGRGGEGEAQEEARLSPLPALFPRPLTQLALPQVLGFILNLPSPVSLGVLSLPLQRRHWVALRQVGNVYYNLDSKLREPVALGGEAELRDFLSAALAGGPCEVLLVVTKEVEGAGSWLQAA
uniref:ubiquitinyl hydrolase 1 n=1 Tax=Sarcophilus harrisii TaxID=9305 RepID=A0A7N4PGW7_SARHA